MKEYKAILGLFLVSLIWGTSFILIDYSLQYLTLYQFQFMRFFLSFIFIVLMLPKKIFFISKKSLKYGVILGISFFTFMSFQTAGLQYTSISKNSFLPMFQVLFVPIIMFLFYKIKPRFNFYIGAVILLLGFGFLIFNINIFDLSNSLKSLAQETNFNFGDLLSLISGILFSFHIVFVFKFVKKEDPFVILMIQLLTSSLLALIFIKISKEQVLIPYATLKQIAIPMIYIALIGSVGAFGGQLVFQKYVIPSKATLILSTEALFASILSI
ncbi:MAG: DMT family transporter, partial [Bacilli bacterium]